MNGRNYAAKDWHASNDQWRAFGPEWNSIRQRAAIAGLLYPPSGTEHDDREAESPSQRSIVWRALNDNPAALYAIVGRSRSWSDVVDRIFGLEARLREDAGLSEKDAAFDKDREPGRHDGLMSIAGMVERIIASRGLVASCPNCGWNGNTVASEPVREAV